MSLDLSGGVSRSGRVRKKSAKLKEMEEIEKSDVNGYSNSSKTFNSSNSLLSSPSFTNISLTDQDSTPRKSKKLKIKFSLDDGKVEEVPIHNEIEQINIDKNYLIKTNQSTVPSFKIKLFQNSVDNYCTLPNKEKKSTTTSKSLYADSENEANLIFQQITSGHISTDSKKKPRKKSHTDYAESLLFDPADESSDEEASLVISDSNESLQAALEHAKAAKNPIRRLTETKIETTKSGLVKLKKVDCKADKKQKLSKVTAYTLFARENRSKIQKSYPHLGFADVSKRLGEVWQGLPQREKMQWKRKAQKQKGLNVQQQLNNQKMSTPIATKLIAIQQTKFVRHNNPSNSINNRNKQRQPEIIVNLYSKTELLNDRQINNYLNEPTKSVTTTTIDLASHLKILGDSLNALSTKLHSNQNLNEADALDLLLDSAVCAMSPLICLTKFVPELNGCSENTQKNLIENVGFLMPLVTSD